MKSIEQRSRYDLEQGGIVTPSPRDRSVNLHDAKGTDDRKTELKSVESDQHRGFQNTKSLRERNPSTRSKYFVYIFMWVLFYISLSSCTLRI